MRPVRSCAGRRGCVWLFLAAGFSEESRWRAPDQVLLQELKRLPEGVDDLAGGQALAGQRRPLRPEAHLEVPVLVVVRWCR